MNLIEYNSELGLVEAYVCGEDLPIGYDVDSLEDNYRFMIKVINYTDDKNMYNLCSERVKSTYEFVVFMVKKFCNDQVFVCGIVDEYLKKTNNEVEQVELLILICSILNVENEGYMVFKLMLEAIYQEERMSITFDKQLYDEESQRIIQMGFWFIIDKYHENENIMFFYAKKFIDEIFWMSDLRLEERLHSEFASLEDLEQIGLNNYIIGVVARFDSNLASYIACHLELLDSLKKDIEVMKRRWHLYNANVESAKFDAIFNEVHLYMEEYGDYCSFTETEILYSIGRELGLEEKMAYYEQLEPELFQEILSSLSDFDKTKMSIADLSHYNSIRKMVVDILSRKTIVDIRSLDKKSLKTRLLVFNPKQNQG